MRYIYILICLLFTFVAAGQDDKVIQAVFAECVSTEKPDFCTFLKFKDDVNQLFADRAEKELMADNVPYLNLAVQFISTDTGTVIEDEIEVLCSNNDLKEAVTKYIKGLRFTPKDGSFKDRRSVHRFMVTFVKNDHDEGYHVALQEEIKEKGITRDAIPLDEYPVFKGCEGINDSDYKCISIKMREYLISKYKLPRIPDATTVKMFVIFIVDEEGDIIVDKITGGADPFVKEVYRVMKKAPKIKPGKVSGIPVKTSFILPLTIKIT